MIALRPTGNAQGSFYFYSLASSCMINWDQWTELPMPKDVIDKVNQMVQQERADRGLVFYNRDNNEIMDYKDDDDNESFHPPDNDNKLDDDDDDDNDDDRGGDGIIQDNLLALKPEPPLPEVPQQEPIPEVNEEEEHDDDHAAPLLEDPKMQEWRIRTTPLKKMSLLNPRM